MQRIQPFPRIILTDHERDTIAALLEQAPCVYNNRRAALVWLARHIPYVLPDRLFEAYFDLANDPTSPGAIQVVNVPVGNATAPSQDNYECVPQAMLLGAMQLLGRPFARRSQNGGVLPNDLVPLPELGDEASNAGWSKRLDLHIEDVAAADHEVPTFVGTLCVQPGLDPPETHVVDIRTVLPGLQPETRAALRRPEFRIARSASFSSGQDWKGPMPVLSGPEDLPHVIAEFNTSEGLTPEAQRALEVFKTAARARAIGIRMERGEMLVLCNRRVMHGRGEFRPRFEASTADRWLMRVAVVADLYPLRDNVPSHSFRHLDATAEYVRDLIGHVATGVGGLDADVVRVDDANARESLARYSEWLDRARVGTRRKNDSPHLELALFLTFDLVGGRLLEGRPLDPEQRRDLALALVHHVHEQARIGADGPNARHISIAWAQLKDALHAHTIARGVGALPQLEDFLIK